MTKWSHWIFAGLMVVALLTTSQSAMANPKNEITYRRAIMKALGGHMSALGTILSGRVKRGKGSVIFHARAIGSIGKLSHTLFAKGTGKGRTRAKPAIWSNETSSRKLSQRSNEPALNWPGSPAKVILKQPGRLIRP